MTDLANIAPVARLPSLPPRIAHAIEAGKLAAQRNRPASAAATAAAPDATSPALSGADHVPTLEFLDARVELHVDKESGLVVGRVIDRRTNEEIRQIPAESMVRMVAALKKDLGPLVNIKA